MSADNTAATMSHDTSMNDAAEALFSMQAEGQAAVTVQDELENELTMVNEAAAALLSMQRSEDTEDECTSSDDGTDPDTIVRPELAPRYDGAKLMPPALEEVEDMIGNYGYKFAATYRPVWWDLPSFTTRFTMPGFPPNGHTMTCWMKQHDMLLFVYAEACQNWANEREHLEYEEQPEHPLARHVPARVCKCNCSGKELQYTARLSEKKRFLLFCPHGQNPRYNSKGYIDVDVPLSTQES